MAATRIADLAAIIDALESEGRLARVKSEVDPRHELAGIAHAFAGGSRAVLFESVKGHRWPVIAGLYWNREIIAGLLGQDEASMPQHIAARIAQWRSVPVDPVVVKSGPVRDVTEREVDLGTIPVPVHALEDGAAHVNAAVVIAKDPETSLRHVSLPRFEVAGRDTLRADLGAGHPLREFLESAQRLGRSLWVTLNCGVGPGLHFAASADVAAGDRDALGLASTFDGAPLELVPGTESDVEMAAHAMWALECEIVPADVAPEAPRQFVRVRRIHRRARPVFQTLLPGLEAGNAAGLVAEARMLSLLQQQVPGVTAVHFVPGGAGLHHAVVQIAPRRTGWSKQAILAAFAALPSLKMVTVVDGDIDLRKAEDVAWAMATRFDAATGVVRIDNAGHGLDGTGAAGAKLGFDATRPLPERADHARVSFKAVALGAYEIAGAAPPVAAQSARGAAPAAPAAPAMAPAPAIAPGAPPAGDFDTDRVWQRQLAEWKSGGKDEAATVKPAASADWDENRWLQRELDAMRREVNGKAAPAAKPATTAAQPPLPSIADAAAAARKSKDWDEDRWLQRELEAMKRERAPKPVPRPAPPLRAAPAKPEPQRAAERSADDDEGSFFRGGAA